MTPIYGQFNSTLALMNALNSYSSNNVYSTYSSPSIFGSFGAFQSLPMFSTPVFTNNNMFGNMFSAFDFAPAAPVMTNVPTSNFNFGTFGTNVSAKAFNPTTPKTPKITSNVVTNAVSLAQSQVGVTEIGSSNDGAAIREYKNGKVNGNAWCASFVSWVYGRGQGGNNAKTFGYDASSQSIRLKAIKAGQYSSVTSSYVPQVGDVAIWRYDSKTGHTGIVTKVYSDGSFDVVEGNCNDKVQTIHRSKNSKNLDGFVRMNEWLQA